MRDGYGSGSSTPGKGIQNGTGDRRSVAITSGFPTYRFANGNMSLRIAVSHYFGFLPFYLSGSPRTSRNALAFDDSLIRSAALRTTALFTCSRQNTGKNQFSGESGEVF